MPPWPKRPLSRYLPAMVVPMCCWKSDMDWFGECAKKRIHTIILSPFVPCERGLLEAHLPRRAKRHGRSWAGAEREVGRRRDARGGSHRRGRVDHIGAVGRRRLAKRRARASTRRKRRVARAAPDGALVPRVAIGRQGQPAVVPHPVAGRATVFWSAGPEFGLAISGNEAPERSHMTQL